MAEPERYRVLKCRLDPDLPLDARIIKYLESQPRNRRGRNTKAMILAAMIRYIEEEMGEAETPPPARRKSARTQPKKSPPPTQSTPSASPSNNRTGDTAAAIRNITAMFGSSKSAS